MYGTEHSIHPLSIDRSVTHPSIGTCFQQAAIRTRLTCESTPSLFTDIDYYSYHARKVSWGIVCHIIATAAAATTTMLMNDIPVPNIITATWDERRDANPQVVGTTTNTMRSMMISNCEIRFRITTRRIAPKMKPPFQRI